MFYSLGYFVLLFLLARITRPKINSEVPHSVCAREFAKRLMSKRGQLSRFLMLVEKCVLPVLLLTVSTRLRIVSQGKTTQNIVEIPTVQERVISFGYIPRLRLWNGSTQFAGRDLWSRVSCEQQIILCFCVLPCTLHSLSRCQCLSHSDSARLLTHPDDSSTSTLSQQKTFAHPISQQIHMSVTNFTWYRSCADSWDALVKMASLNNIDTDGPYDGQQRSLNSTLRMCSRCHSWLGSQQKSATPPR